MTDLKAPYLDARARLTALVDGLDSRAFNRKPSPRSWSAGECVVHLNTIAKGYLPVMEEAAARPGPAGRPPFRYGWLGRRFIEAVRPGSRSLPTAGSMKPPASAGGHSAIDMARAVERFNADIDRYLAVIDASAALDLSRIRLRSPFLPLMKLPLGVYLEALGLHAVRHVLQAERALASPA